VTPKHNSIDPKPKTSNLKPITHNP